MGRATGALKAAWRSAIYGTRLGKHLVMVAAAVSEKEFSTATTKQASKFMATECQLERASRACGSFL